MAGRDPYAGESTTERGYGSEHQKARAQWKAIVDAGQAWCQEAVCLQRSRWIRPGTEWDLAHTPDRSAYLGPAHSGCNRSEGGRRGNRMRRGKTRRTGKTRPASPGWFPTSRNW